MKFGQEDTYFMTRKLRKELSQAFDNERFEALTEIYSKEYEEFVRIVIEFVRKARNRWIVLHRVNFWDWLRLQWWILKREIRELIIKGELSSVRKYDEEQTIFCSRIILLEIVHCHCHIDLFVCCPFLT